ncbi:MAG TPA: heme-binding protein [Acidobacteriaceae bacterium]|nr:heme-binding protein [Acidobacteriaceae bacterium]
MSLTQKATIALSEGFEFNEVRPNLTGVLQATLNPPLGAIAPLAGVTFTGTGFNNIFRPQNSTSPTPLPVPQPGSDNILELNLTTETLAFAGALGNVPNRGFAQKDLFLNGIPYVQTINDVTFPGQSPAIHFEPGMWLAVPATANPAINEITYVRQASIPHGVTIQLQGTASALTNGAPTIPPVNINPFSIGGTQPPIGNHPFASQVAAQHNTPRIPQDLTSYIAAGTITQAILDDPNTVLRNHLIGQTILNFTRIDVTSQPAIPIFGGGTDNIAFLLGDKNTPPTHPNAHAFKCTATFWIETVQEKIIIPVFKPGQPPLSIRGAARATGPTPIFSVTPPAELLVPHVLTTTFTQIQYSQTVNLNFNTLTWPHVSVGTLVPSEPIVVPHTAWP